MGKTSITTEIVDGHKYLTTTYRNVEYTLRHDGFGWVLRTRRLGYGGNLHYGTVKVFDHLSHVAAACKAFGTYHDLLAINYFGKGEAS
jgi:hypothetical protein